MKSPTILTFIIYNYKLVMKILAAIIEFGGKTIIRKMNSLFSTRHFSSYCTYCAYRDPIENSRFWLKSTVSESTKK